MDKKKLTWGIILLLIGLIAIFGSGGKSGGYVVVCIAFIIIGIILLLKYFRARKNHYERVKQDHLAEADAAEAERKAASARYNAEAARYKAEEIKYKAEAARYEYDLNKLKTCKACGATTKGNYCEYCGTRLSED